MSVSFLADTIRLIIVNSKVSGSKLSVCVCIYVTTARTVDSGARGNCPSDKSTSYMQKDITMIKILLVANCESFD